MLWLEFSTGGRQESPTHFSGLWLTTLRIWLFSDNDRRLNCLWVSVYIWFHNAYRSFRFSRGTCFRFWLVYTAGSSCFIIIISRRQHGSPWPSLATRLYRPSLPEVLQALSCFGTELLYISFSWSSYLCSSVWKGPREYIAYEVRWRGPQEYIAYGSERTICKTYLCL